MRSTVFAQSLGEYGILTSLESGSRDLVSVITRRIADLSPRSWVVITGIALVAVWFWVRRE